MDWTDKLPLEVQEYVHGLQQHCQRYQQVLEPILHKAEQHEVVRPRTPLW